MEELSDLADSIRPRDSAYLVFPSRLFDDFLRELVDMKIAKGAPKEEIEELLGILNRKQNASTSIVCNGTIDL